MLKGGGLLVDFMLSAADHDLNLLDADLPSRGFANSDFEIPHAAVRLADDYIANPVIALRIDRHLRGRISGDLNRDVLLADMLGDACPHA